MRRYALSLSAAATRTGRGAPSIGAASGSCASGALKTGSCVMYSERLRSTFSTITASGAQASISASRPQGVSFEKQARSNWLASSGISVLPKESRNISSDALPAPPEVSIRPSSTLAPGAA